MKALLVFAILIILLLLTFVLKLFMKNRKLTRIVKKTEKWHELALTDALTGLYNRTAYDKYVSDIEFGKNKRNFIITLFDIDDFKKINDEKGHLEGDSVLKYVAKTLSKVFSAPQYKLFRLGGDEFAVISKGLTEEYLIYDLIYLNETLENDGNIRLSKGYSPINKNFESAFKEADEMLYADKLAKYRK